MQADPACPPAVINLRIYRLAFAPALLAVIVLMFSLEGAPDAVEPASTTATFDGERATADARRIAALAPDREPGSSGDNAVADLVTERFKTILTGAVSEQRFDAEVDGESVSLRNVLLSLPGNGDGVVVIVAGRDSPDAPGAASSAAATGVLLELASSLGVGQQTTYVLASTSGDTTAAIGTRAVLDALPDRDTVNAVIVISQPGSIDPVPPHVIDSSTGESSGSVQLERTAERAVGAQTPFPAGGPSAFTQLARLAIPSGLGAQAPLIADGFDAIAISSAGERPLAASADGVEDLSGETVDAFGRAVQSTVAAIDLRGGDLEHGPSIHVEVGDNLVPGWALSLLALTLILPAAAAAVDACARVARGPASAVRGIAWAAARSLPFVGASVVLYALALVGAVPRPAFPFDPGLYEFGTRAAIVLAAMLLAAAASAYLLRSLRVGGATARGAAVSGLGAVSVGACSAIWLANPYLALLLAPAAHLWLLAAARGRARRTALVIVATAIACVPAFAAAAAVADALNLGAGAPWTFAIMVADGQIGLAIVAPLCFLAGALVGAIAVSGRRRAEAPAVHRSPRSNER